jgi:hypothetical protein
MLTMSCNIQVMLARVLLSSRPVALSAILLLPKSPTRLAPTCTGTSSRWARSVSGADVKNFLSVSSVVRLAKQRVSLTLPPT